MDGWGALVIVWRRKEKKEKKEKEKKALAE